MSAGTATDTAPPRALAPMVELVDVVRGEAHVNRGKLSETLDGRSDFIQMRSPKGAVKLARTHAPVYGALLRLSLAKRVSGDDGGVTHKDICEALGIERTALAPIVRSLRQNGVLRSVRVHEGYLGSHLVHYPTEQGAFLFALAEQLGPGVQITTGGSQSRWRGRNQSEPSHVFEFAARLNGQKGRRREKD